MIVVADTSPLNYIIQIGGESLLPELYTRVIVPAAVLAELGDPSAPSVVGQWLSRIPEWIDVRTTSSPPDTALAALDPGEQQAIQLAEEEHAELLLIDERKGRVEAMRRGLTTTGTLGVSLAAAERGSIDAAAAFRRLIAETTFRSTPALQRFFCNRSGKFLRKTPDTGCLGGFGAAASRRAQSELRKANSEQRSPGRVPACAILSHLLAIVAGSPKLTD